MNEGKNKLMSANIIGHGYEYLNAFSEGVFNEQGTVATLLKGMI